MTSVWPTAVNSQWLRVSFVSHTDVFHVAKKIAPACCVAIPVAVVHIDIVQAVPAYRITKTHDTL